MFLHEDCNWPKQKIGFWNYHYMVLLDFLYCPCFLALCPCFFEICSCLFEFEAFPYFFEAFLWIIHIVHDLICVLNNFVGQNVSHHFANRVKHVQILLLVSFQFLKKKKKMKGGQFNKNIYANRDWFLIFFQGYFVELPTCLYAGSC